MSLLTKSVPVVTNGSGAATATVRGAGVVIRCIDFELGTLETPDIDITDEDTGTVLLSVDAVAADTRYVPTIEGTDSAGAGSTTFVPFAVMGRLEIAITGGGNAKTGRFVILYEK